MIKKEVTSLDVLLKQRINLEGAEKTGWHTTTGSRDKRATQPDNVRILRIGIGWTSGSMGNICEDQTKILVEEYVETLPLY